MSVFIVNIHGRRNLMNFNDSKNYEAFPLCHAEGTNGSSQFSQHDSAQWQAGLLLSQHHVTDAAGDPERKRHQMKLVRIKHGAQW